MSQHFLTVGGAGAEGQWTGSAAASNDDTGLNLQEGINRKEIAEWVLEANVQSGCSSGCCLLHYPRLSRTLLQ